MIDDTQRQTVASDQSLAGLLDQICDRFETACKGAPPPRLEDFLGDVPPSAADRGFRELLELELAYRRRAGQTPSADEYRSRFPQHTATIDQLLKPPGTRPTVAGPFSDTISARLAGSFSDVVPADTQLSSAAGPTRSVGTTTSSGLRFRVVRKHAKGGLGEVFIAEDQELHREVALKQIQSRYADDTNSRTRFVLEAEVTGALEHPGIVPVYGLGTYADGRPFYAMRFIHGDSLKDAIDAFHDIDSGPRGPGEHALELRKLLGRFVDVCDAIEYAHSRGIIHRDLKPGNIMLGKFGETLVVDWGLAKQVNQSESGFEPAQVAAPAKPMLLSGTAATQMGSAVGTPQYMSPEQAAGRLDLVGPRSDVYSLGATLYCLLTGKAPLSDRTTFDVGEILRRVQAGEIEPARAVNAAVPKPLEAICLKAMGVRPENRYASARQLADDIEHWLADEPISAQPDTRTQLVARWIRRHRSLASASAIALLLITLVSTVATLLVNHQRQLADTAKGQAETGFREARGAVDDLFTKVSDTTLLNQPGAQELRKQLLEKTLVYYKRFIDERADDPTLQDELGVTYFHVGRIEEEMASPEKGLAYYLQAQQIQVRLVAKSPRDSQRLNALGDTFNAIGGALKKGHRLDDALKAFGQAREMRQELAVLTPQNAGYALALANAKMNVGLVERMLGHADDALDEEKQAQQIRRAHLNDSPDKSKLEKDMAMGSYNLGVLELGLKRVKDAQKDFAESIGLFKQLNIRDQHDLTIQKLLATCYRLQGVSLSQSSADLAVRSYQQARDAFARLVDQNPDVSDYKSELAGVYMNMASTQRGSESIASFEQARQILEDLAQKFPKNPQHGRDLALTLQSLADRQIKTGKFEAARINLEKSLALLTRLNEGFPNDPDIIQKLAEGRAALRQMDERKPVSPPSAPAPPQKSPASPSSSSS